MITVALDATALGRNKTGNETYIQGYLDGFLETQPDDIRLTCIVTPEYTGVRDSRINWVEVPAGNFFRRHFYDIPRCLRKIKPAIYHASYWAPIPLCARTLLTIHDVSFIRHPEWFPLHHYWAYRILIAMGLRHACGVVTVSRFSRREILDVYSMKEESVCVSHLGVSKIYRPGEVSATGAEPFFLCVANQHPRKNLIRLIRAFERFRVQNAGYKLFLVGPEGWHINQLKQLVEKIDGVENPGFIEQHQLVELYRNARGLLLPSLYEGFGLPVLEAMACGCPVLLSDIEPFREVAGDAAIYFDPHSPESMADCMRKIVSDDALRSQMIMRGIDQARSYTWSQMATTIFEFYRKLQC